MAPLGIVGYTLGNYRLSKGLVCRIRAERIADKERASSDGLAGSLSYRCCSPMGGHGAAKHEYLFITIHIFKCSGNGLGLAWVKIGLLACCVGIFGLGHQVMQEDKNYLWLASS